MASNSAFLLYLTLSLLLLTSRAHGEEDESSCVYLIYVKTGSVKKAGTHSTISLEVKTAEGEGISVADLEEWGGIMGSDYNFFETGHLDIFTGRGPCLASPLCSLNLTSDGSGPYHAWYCEYVEVTATGLGHPCRRRRFPVQQWLARDQDPYSLTAVQDYCHSTNAYGIPSHGNQDQFNVREN